MYVQVTEPRRNALAYCLDQARGLDGYEKFSHKTGIDMRALVNISIGKIKLPVKEKNIHTIIANSEGRIEEDVFFAANGFLNDRYLRVVHSSQFGMVGEKIAEYHTKKDDNLQKYTKFLEKASVLTTNMSDKAIRAFSVKQKSLFKDPVFNKLLDDFIEIYEKEETHNMKKITEYYEHQKEREPIPQEETKGDELRKMLEDLIISI